MCDDTKILIDNVFKVGLKDNSTIYFETIEELEEIRIPYKNKRKAARVFRTIVQMKEESSSTVTEVPYRNYTVLPPQRSGKTFKSKKRVTCKPKSATVL